jgi:cytochrome c biogenesis protein CcmG, thiol:disulfide interchange protein DsbE
MRRRLLPLAVVALGVVLLGALFAFGLRRDPAALHSALLGRTAPDFSLTTLDGGQQVRLSALKGQVVVLNFWASWCAECRIEDPDLAGAFRRYRDQRVVVLGVSFQDSAQAGLAYARSHGLDWPLLADPDSRTGLAYGISGVPETVFIGPDGKVAAKQVGPVSYQLLADRIGQLLAETPES